MRRIALILSLLLTVTLAGCSSTGSSESGEPPDGQSGDNEDAETENTGDGAEETNALYDESIFELAFGDDESEEDSGNKGSATADAETSELRQEVARLRNALNERARKREPSEGQQRTGPALGIVFSEGEAIEAPMLSALNRASGSFPLRIMSPGKITPVMQRQGCSVSAPTDCLDDLAVQPGTRLLAVVASRPATQDNETRLRFRLYDTDLGLSYAPVTLALPKASDGEQPNAESWLAAADAILLHSMDHLELTPTIVHAVENEGDTVYLNQGRAVGLSKGQRLIIHGSARTVRGPSGLPATWIPGASEGIVEVTRVGGDGNAVGRVIQGSKPRSADYLLPQGADTE